jgi:hypothetical protein
MAAVMVRTLLQGEKWTELYALGGPLVKGAMILLDGPGAI